jgi:LPS-assembly lipoprotein
MSSSDRRQFLTILFALPVAACGFTPVYRAGGPAADLDGAFRISFEGSRDGYHLYEALEARLGPARTPRYDLATTLSVDEQRIVLVAATGVARISAYGAVAVRVTALETGALVFERTYRDVASYSATSETAVTQASRAKAYDRLMEVMADRIALDLAASAGDWSA